MGTRDISTEEIPPIYVSEPGYDDMGAILDRLDIDYSPVDSVDISRLQDAIVILNCSFSWRDEIDMSNVEAFVENGGTLMASDLAAPAMSSFTRARFQSGGWGDYVQADIEDQEMVELLGQDSIQLDFDTAIKEPTELPEAATPLLRASNRGSVIAYKFSHGQGNAVYTTFHNHSQPSEVEDALLQVLLMGPIAESTNTTVTETYTSIVEEADSGDTQLIDPDTGDTTVVHEQTTADESDTELFVHEATTDVHLTPASGTDDEITRSIPEGESVQLGRIDFDGVVDDDNLSYISSEHFQLRHLEDGNPPIEIRDTDSTNGTELNERDISDGEYYEVDSDSRLDLAEGYVTLTLSYET